MAQPCAGEFTVLKLLSAQVHGSVMGLKGRLQFQNTTGAPLEQYSLAVEVEDGTLATTAMLTHDVLMPFLGVSST